ncbi:MAG TPA: hypothetical protein VJJ23_04340 [Candidatus Nanoarchaeia archaeon]|nr:hypothetical protein [Candidatus Nanoarchaeia archaeon]
MTNGTKMIMRELKGIKTEIKHLKKHLVDVDRILTYDDIISLREAEIDLKKGKTKRIA